VNSWARIWLSAFQQAAEIGWYAPVVIGKRLQRFGAAGKSPSAADQGEWIRMVTEKNAAAFESATALWAAAVSAQQDAWIRALQSGRVSPPRLIPDRKTARRLVRSLRPVSRRVKANARRLTRRR
jgi:hypothetical protein